MAHAENLQRTVAAQGRAYFVHLLVGVWAAIALGEIFVPGTDLLSWIAVALIGLLFWPLSRFSTSKEKRFLVLAFLVLLQFMYFVVPFLAPRSVLESPFMGATFDPAYGVYILMFSGAFLLLFEVGFMVSSGGRGGELSRRIEEKLFSTLAGTPPILFIAAMAAMLIAWNYHWDSRIPDSLAFIRHLLSLTVPFCLVALFLRPRPKVIWALVFGVVYPCFYLIQIANGFLASWLIGNAVILFGYALTHKKVLWSVGIVAAVATAPLMPTKSTYRTEYIQTERWLEMTRLEAGWTFAAMTADYFNGELNVRHADIATEQSVTRMTMAPIVFSRVLQLHENGVAEFQDGATLWDLPLSIIPRAIFPWKPEKTTGQWFGHTYGFLSPMNFRTSVNLPPIIESYVNFGSAGPLVGLLLGLITGWLSRVLGNAETSASAFAIALVFSGFGNAETAISIVYGQALQALVLVWAVMYFLQPKAPTVAPQPGVHFAPADVRGPAGERRRLPG